MASTSTAANTAAMRALASLLLLLLLSLPLLVLGAGASSATAKDASSRSAASSASAAVSSAGLLLSVDLGACDASAAVERDQAAALATAARDMGFFVVTNHGAEAGMVALEEAARAFFARLAEAPAAEVDALRMARSGKAWRGYFSVGEELTSGKVDNKEGLYFGTEDDPDDARPLHGSNLWPGERLDPGGVLRKAVEAHTAAMRRVALRVSELLSLALELTTTTATTTAGTAAAEAPLQSSSGEHQQHQEPAVGDDDEEGSVAAASSASSPPRPRRGRHFLRDALQLDDATELFRIFNYPVMDEAQLARGEWSVGEHVDYGFLTLLFQDASGGLQVRNGTGHMVDVPPEPGALVINLGDMAERLTRGRFRSAPHRVRHAQAGAASRLSAPFFFDPCWESPVEPLFPPAAAATGAPSDSGDGTEAVAAEGEDDVAAPSEEALARGARWDGVADVADVRMRNYGEYLVGKVGKVFVDLAQDTNIAASV